MPNQEIAQELRKLVSVFNAQRVVSKEELKGVLQAIVSILAESKKGVESLNAETRKQLETAQDYLTNEHTAVLKRIEDSLSSSKADIEKATKAQNDRAFKRLQTLIAAIKMPADGKDGKDGADGKDGKDGSPDTAEQVRDKLETLGGNDRLDASAIKGLPDYIKTVKKAGKQMLVGGIRFLENLADVSVPITDKRQDLLIQYSTTNNRWESGVALTVSATEPTNPKENDLWVDIS